MKLILKEYLSSLKERDELDAILPDLLSELGLSVFSKPGRGTRQNGVDVAAFGSLKGSEEKVFLFSIKSGDITRNIWDGDALQSLRPSLNEIIDTYIPNRIPSQYNGKPIVICICFGGDIQEQAREQVEGYKKANSGKGFEFDEWNGDRMSELILSSFLREDLLPKSFQSALRKSLALLDEPEISFKHFSHLVHLLTNTKTIKAKEIVTIARQLNISLWILFAWSREANNLESAYLAGEFTILHSWEICAPFFDRKSKDANKIQSTFKSIQYLYRQISIEYVKKILPCASKFHGLSNAINALNRVDINFKLFDLVGRIALNGIWSYWYFAITSEKELKSAYEADVQLHIKLVKEIIINNPILYSPYRDNQAIDISLVAWLLSINTINYVDVHNWFLNLIRSVEFNFDTHSNYPCILKEYYDHINHPLEKTKEYREEITAASILYPTLAAFSAILNFEDVYLKIKEFEEKSLKHCNFQFWFPDETTDTHFYKNSDLHGATLSNLSLEKPSKDFIEGVFKECEANSHFENMSAFKFGLWPLIFVGCRHYRMPIPVHFIKMLKQK